MPEYAYPMSLQELCHHLAMLRAQLATVTPEELAQHEQMREATEQRILGRRVKAPDGQQGTVTAVTPDGLHLQALMDGDELPTGWEPRELQII